MPKPKTLILRTAGTNCDYETEYAFRLAGADTELVHINELARGERSLAEYQILAIPGGFTYGDDVAAGKILANELRYKLEGQVEQFLADGKLILGICNGFQVLVQAGLLPALDGPGQEQQATLTDNDSGKFEDRWVYLRPEESVCVFTRGVEEILYFPVAHAEGKFVPKDRDVLRRLNENGQIVFRYMSSEGKSPTYPWNPNGSAEHIAGICDSTGRVLGLMPHPERHILGTHHPRWTREGLRERGDGLILFENAVRYAR